jgi:hypothetical protein
MSKYCPYRDVKQPSGEAQRRQTTFGITAKIFIPSIAAQCWAAGGNRKLG